MSVPHVGPVSNRPISPSGKLKTCPTALLPTLDYTGERMIPEQAEHHTFWEHIYRYRFAVAYVRDRRVLDIACGEGYGAHALLKAGAASVVGIDISEEACAHARQRYGVDARLGDAECIPLPDRSIDVVVSFETVEHVSRPKVFVSECARVLVPDGILIISTPNRPVYRQAAKNPFHCSEMDREEFLALLAPEFGQVELYAQTPMTAAWWSPRSWLALRSGWDQMRGFWRLKSLLCPHIFRAGGARYRHATADAVLMKERFYSTWVNPFAVRGRARWGGEQPVYFLAVARKRGARD